MAPTAPEPSRQHPDFSHVQTDGGIRMVDVGDKPPVKRTAVAEGHVRMAPATVALLTKRLLAKGDALVAAQLAGIAAAKRTSDLIPLSHNIPLDVAAVTCAVVPDGVIITATARCTGRTGVEMEALTAVSVAALTVYDMCKAVDKTMVIDRIHLVGKHKEQP